MSLIAIPDYKASLDEAWTKAHAPRDKHPRTVVSTFAGCGGSSLGYATAGYKELLAVEWDANAAATFRLNFPDVPVFEGDIAALSVAEALRMTGLQPGELDVLDGSPPCFPAGYSVLTTLGKISIESCTTGMEVLTHNGRFKKITRTMVRKYSGSLCTIKVKYGRQPISCTPEHPFLARRRIKTQQGKAYSDPQWIAAKDLVAGDVVCEPHISGRQSLNIPMIITKQRINIAGASGSDLSEMRLLERHCSVNWQSDDMAWMLGFYLAEGHTRGHSPSLENDGAARREVILSVADKEAVDIALRLERMGFHAMLQKHSQGSSRVSVSSVDLWALCQTVGKYADGKFIPASFHCMPVKWQGQFLDGYFAGDGCVYSSKIVNSQKRKATTVSLDIATGIAKMVARVHGVVASIEVLYPAGHAKIQGRTVNVKEAYCVGYTLVTSQRVRPGSVDAVGAWIPIKEINATSVEEIDVYNLEVEEDHSYTVEGLAVHNCQGFSLAGKRILDDPRNQLFREFVRLLSGLQPRAFIMENVSGMVRGKMKLAFAEILKELRACGYNVRASLLDTSYYGVAQARHRIIFVGVRNDLNIQPSHPEPWSMPVCAEDALVNCQPGEMPTLTANFLRMWQLCALGGSFKSVSGNGNYFNARKLHPHKPCPTIPKTVLVRKSLKESNTALYHWSIPAVLSIPMLKRFGGFPDQFQFIGNFREQWARIGNSVPPPLMAAIARHLIELVPQAQVVSVKKTGSAKRPHAKK
jgi:DNA (cytosine-5)-methyltransferase 1